MTDRQFVESTVSYLAEHVPWMHREFCGEANIGLWPVTLFTDPAFGNCTGWRELLDRLINPKGNPLVSADWWDERGEPKLAELLRKQAGVAAECPCCKRVVAVEDIQIRGRNSAYADEEANLLRSCSECFDEDWSQLQDQWDEYYGSRL